MNDSAPFARRLPAAKAISVLNTALLPIELAQLLGKGSVPERILAVHLLMIDKPESLQALETFCIDPNDGVAAAAWTAVYRLDSQRLVSLLETGRHHNDAVIRMTAAECMQTYESMQHCEWLNEMLGDEHLEVRNTAREQLVLIANKSQDFLASIVNAASDNLLKEESNWQGLEQSLLLLAQLHGTSYAQRCIPLVDYPRSEVAVTAAWLLHLYPDDRVNDQVLELISRKDDLVKSGEWVGMPAGESFGLQVTHLFHFAGLQRLRSVEPRLENSFSKAEPGVVEKRAAAMWALGLLNEKSGNAGLSGKLISRARDRDGMPPEWTIVRNTCIRALGMIQADSAIDVLKESYDVESAESLIPHAARWGLIEMQAADLPEPEPYTSTVGGFRLNPAVSRTKPAEAGQPAN
ncbi:MAG: hypothetical protein R3C20_17885 [Planctomycetaceae bacterium]